MIYYRKTEGNIFARIEEAYGIAKGDFVKIENGNFAIQIDVVLNAVATVKFRTSTPESNKEDFYSAYLYAKKELEKRLEKLINHDIHET